MSAIGMIIAIGVPVVSILVLMFIIIAIIDGLREALYITGITLAIMVVVVAFAVGGISLGHAIS